MLFDIELETEDVEIRKLELKNVQTLLWKLKNIQPIPTDVQEQLTNDRVWGVAVQVSFRPKA